MKTTFKTLSLRTSLTLGLIAVMTLMLVVSLVAVHELRVGAGHTEELAETSVPEARALGEISTQVFSLRSAQADLVAGGRRHLEVLRPAIAENHVQMRRAIKRYAAVADEPGEKERLAAFNATWSRYVLETAGLPDVIARGDYPAARAVLSRPLPLFGKARDQLFTLQAIESRNLAATVADAQAGSASAKSLMIKLTLVGLLLCLGVAVAVRHVGERGITLLSGFRSAFEDSGNGGALLDERGTVVHVNRALCDILERPASELVGHRLDDLLPPEPDGDGVERCYHRPDGEPRWVAVSRSAVRDTEPDLAVRAVVQVEDVTERKHAELALGASEERFRSAFDETNIGMAILDAEGQILRINGGLEQTILGYGSEELIGQPIMSLTHPEDQADDAQISALLLSGEKTTVEGERRYRHSNGWWVWCHLNLSAIRDDDGEVRQFVIQVQDIMQRRAVEQFLRESEDRYRSLVEHLPLITYRDRLDAENSVLFMSPQIEDISGYPVQDWIDDPTMLAQVVHPEDRERVLAEMARANAELADLHCEFRTVARDGRVSHVLKEGVVVFDQGMPIYRQGYILDVTDRHALEDQLRLAQKLESVGQMAAGIAHEINTPIQFVGDSVAFARDAVDDLLGLVPAIHAAIDELPGPQADEMRAKVAAAEDDADVEYLRERLPAAFDRTADGIERVASIVRAMKAFAHPSTGAHSSVDINESIRTTLVVAKAEYKYVADVELDLDEALPVISGDVGELNQVLLNIIVNAGHAIADHPQGDGGRGRITIATRGDGDTVRVAIADTGGGIPDAVRARIFDPFFTTKEVGRGTGQGLAIARSIVVDSHGGRIDVDTEPGVGTTMSIILPIAAREQLQEAA